MCICACAYEHTRVYADLFAKTYIHNEYLFSTEKKGELMRVEERRIDREESEQHKTTRMEFQAL
jgi:hypothetical protein